MKEFEELNDLERIVLLASYDANNSSLSSHVPIQAIRRRINKSQHRHFKKAFDVLVKSGFILNKPTRRKMTYGLTTKGLRYGNILKDDI